MVGGIIAAVLVGEARSGSPAADPKLLDAAAILVGLIFLVAGFYVRVRYAGWYVRDKNRLERWKWISLFGVWGWVGLILLQDRSDASGYLPPAPGMTSPLPQQPGSRGLSNWVAYLILALGILLTGLMVWSGFQDH
jgi:hypothetical protein